VHGREGLLEALGICAQSKHARSQDFGYGRRYLCPVWRRENYARRLNSHWTPANQIGIVTAALLLHSTVAGRRPAQPGHDIMAGKTGPMF
jgi:hypothetical protein